MYINYLDLFSIHYVPNNGHISSFLSEEYKENLSETKINDVLINLTLTNNEREESDYILRDPVSYDDLGVFIFDKHNKKLRIDFSTMGDEITEVVCDPNFHPPFFAIFIDFLVFIYALVQRKALIHSSCFIYKGFKILCPAWRNVGKTNLLLSFMNDEALYLADDWSLINELGYVEKISKNVCLFDYNIFAYPQLASKIDTSLLPLIEFVGLVDSGIIKLSEFVHQNVRENLIKRVHPDDLFPGKVAKHPQKIDYIFNLVKNSINPEQEVASSGIELETLVRRTYEILCLEQSPFRLAYSAYKARTGLENSILNTEREIFFDLARNAFKDAEIFELLIPNQKSSEKVKLEMINRLGLS